MQVSPSLIKRQKTHFHNLPCGASIILANNGFVWLYPTPEQQEEEAGGFYTSLEVRKQSLQQHFIVSFLQYTYSLYNLSAIRNICLVILCCLKIVKLVYFCIWFLSFQPVNLSDREVISRLRNCIMALAAHKVLLFDTSVLYCFESSLQHQV